MFGITELDYGNYSKYFNNLLYLEELQMRRDMERYTIPDAQMTKDTRTGLLSLEVRKSFVWWRIIM